MQSFLLKNIYSDSKLVRLGIIIGFIMCLNLIFKYINSNFKTIETNENLLPGTSDNAIIKQLTIDELETNLQPGTSNNAIIRQLTIDELETEILKQIQSYIEFTRQLLLDKNLSMYDKMKLSGKRELIEILPETIKFEKINRTAIEIENLDKLNQLFDGIDNIVKSITTNIFYLQKTNNFIDIYDSTKYDPINKKTDIKRIIENRDILYNKTKNIIDTFINLNSIEVNTNKKIRDINIMINQLLNDIKENEMPNYNIKKIIQKNIQQIQTYDTNINANPPMSDIGIIKLKRFNLYNETKNMVQIEKDNRPTTDTAADTQTFLDFNNTINSLGETNQNLN